MAFGAKLIERCIGIDRVPKHDEIDDEPECAKLILLSFMVALTQFATLTMTPVNSVLYGYDPVGRLTMAVSSSGGARSETSAYNSGTNRLASVVNRRANGTPYRRSNGTHLGTTSACKRGPLPVGGGVCAAIRMRSACRSRLPRDVRAAAS